MGDATPRRRDRLRAETSSEIKSIALTLLSTNGADAVSLRAIAREMGMTAGAIYSYYANRDELITALITDVYGALADVMEAAYETVPAGEPGRRVLAVGQAYRQWALANPEEFRLIYGDPVPGYQPPTAVRRRRRRPARAPCCSGWSRPAGRTPRPRTPAASSTSGRISGRALPAG